MISSQSKFWVFTLNNYTQEELTLIRSLVETSNVSYVVIGMEIGEQGTPHVQGYLELSKRLRGRSVLKLSGMTRCHLETRQGTQEEATRYSKKDGIFEEYGELSVNDRGRRSDLESLKTDLDSGKSLMEISDTHFATYLRYERSITKYRALRDTSRNWLPDVQVFWGKTGTGKTRKVYEENVDIYTHAGDRWFDGYEGQEVVLFDDFDGSVFKLAYLLKLLDRYQMRVPVKGGFIQWVPKKIYITSNINPQLWYSGANAEHQAALMRRLASIRYFQ